MLLADLICHSHTPPILLAVEGLCLSSNEPFSSRFHQEVIDLLFVHSIECPFQLSACANKVATIVASDNPNISSPADESAECLNKAISGHTVCCLYMKSTTAQACKHCGILFVHFSAFFDQPWLKHIYITVAKRWFLYQLLFWKVTHLFAMDTFQYHWFHSSSIIDYPESIVPYFIYCHSSATMSNPSVIKI